MIYVFLCSRNQLMGQGINYRQLLSFYLLEEERRNGLENQSWFYY
jgi:hypothetical protein